MSKKGNQAKVKKHYIVLLIFGLVILFSAIYLLNKSVAVNNDKQKFMAVERKKSDIATKLVTYLGNKVVAVREQNECFNTEQGPFDNGRLWCQTATVVKLNSDISYEEVGQEYLKIGVSFGRGFASNDKVFPSYWINLYEGMDCQIGFQGSDKKNLGSIRRIPFDNYEQPVLAIACADRAKAKHYPFVE